MAMRTVLSKIASECPQPSHRLDRKARHPAHAAGQGQGRVRFTKLTTPHFHQSGQSSCHPPRGSTGMGYPPATYGWQKDCLGHAQESGGTASTMLKLAGILPGFNQGNNAR